MGLFSTMFGGKDRGTTALIVDVGSASVGGAYVRFAPDAPPEMYYTARLPIERREGEDSSSAGMERSLVTLTDTLTREGAPALMRALGSAQVNRVLIAVGSPWEETVVHIDRIDKEKPFTFTRAIVKEISREAVPAGRRATEDRIISTLLNGYQVGQPFGKRASQAEVTVLASTIDESAAAAIDKAVARAFHTHRIELHAVLPAVYGALASLYPHQKEHFIVVVGGDATEIGLVSRGVLAGARSIPRGVRELTEAAHTAGARTAGDPVSSGLMNNLIDPARNQRFAGAVEQVKRGWTAALQKEMQAFAETSALPGTVFLVTHKEASAMLADALGDPQLATGITGGNPLTVIPVSAGHLASYVRVRAEAQADTGLMLLAVYQALRFGETIPGDTPVAA